MSYPFFEGALWFFYMSTDSTDTWDLGLKSHPNDMVWRGIERMTPGSTVQHATPRPRSVGLALFARWAKMIDLYITIWTVDLQL